MPDSSPPLPTYPRAIALTERECFEARSALIVRHALILQYMWELNGDSSAKIRARELYAIVSAVRKLWADPTQRPLAEDMAHILEEETRLNIKERFPRSTDLEPTE